MSFTGLEINICKCTFYPLFVKFLIEYFINFNAFLQSNLKMFSESEVIVSAKTKNQSSHQNFNIY